MKKLPTLLIVTAILLGGCVPQWVKLDKPEQQQIAAERYEIVLPKGWVKIDRGDTLEVSRDGPDLQQVAIRAVAHDKAFPQIEKSTSESMLPSELSAMFIAELKKTHEDGLPSLVVEQNEPATVGGRDGFRLLLDYATDSGVRYRELVYGAVTDKGPATISYVAPRLYYFERDLPTFEAMLSTLKLK
jgi:hypothetical protein